MTNSFNSLILLMLIAATACKSSSGSGTDDATTPDVLASDTTSDVGDATISPDATADVSAPLCGGLCKQGEICDTKVSPNVCKVVTPECWCIEPNPPVQKFVQLALAATLDACDLTGDGQPDNAFAGAGLELQSAVNSGALVLLLNPIGFNTNGTAFLVDAVRGDADPTSLAEDMTAAGGKYTVRAESYDLTQCDATGCPAVVAFKNAKIVNGTLTGQASQFLLPVRINGVSLTLRIQNATISGQVTGDTAWQSTPSGRLCGTVDAVELANAVTVADATELAKVGGAAAFSAWLDQHVLSDVATAGAGAKNGKSIALQFATKSVVIIGLGASKP